MNKKSLSALILSLLIVECCFAQKIFDGKLVLKGNSVLKYKLVLNNFEDSGVVSGYSITDEMGKHEIKTLVKGSFNAKTRLLHIEEYKIEKSATDLNNLSLCYVNADVKYLFIGKDSALVGNFKGLLYPKNDICATGSVILKQILLKKHTNKKKETDIKKTGDDEEQTSNDKPIEIITKKGKEFLITGNTVTFTIWDNGQVDGDKISVLLNGKYILQDYTITSVTKIMQVQLSGNDRDTIEVVALNEGSLPPNTAAIKIETKTEQYQILTQAKTNEVRTIYLRKK